MKYNHRDHRGVNPISRNEPAGALEIQGPEGGRAMRAERGAIAHQIGCGWKRPKSDDSSHFLCGSAGLTRRKSTHYADANAAVDGGC